MDKDHFSPIQFHMFLIYDLNSPRTKLAISNKMLKEHAWGVSKPTALIGWRQLNEVTTRSPRGHESSSYTCVLSLVLDLVVFVILGYFLPESRDRPIWHAYNYLVVKWCRIWPQNGSGWIQMGQIWDFLRSVSVHFGSPRTSCCFFKTIFVNVFAVSCL